MSLVHVAQEKNSRNAVGAYKIINNEISKSKKNDTDVTLRYYGLGAQIIKDFNVKNMILLSRSKKKILGVEGYGLKIKKQVIIK